MYMKSSDKIATLTTPGIAAKNVAKSVRSPLLTCTILNNRKNLSIRKAPPTPLS